MDKYYPLGQYLQNSKKSTELLTFSEITKILGSPLPCSALTYRQWWENDKIHSQSKAWINAGWKVDHVNFGINVTFIKS
jgi:hypothetical protein